MPCSPDFDFSFLAENTFWTAAAVIVALILGVMGPFLHHWIERNWKRPKLSIAWNEVEEVSEEIDQNGIRSRWAIRVPVKNENGRKPAHDVEVFIESISGKDENGETHVPKYLPVRIPWAHVRETESKTEASTCRRIVGGGKQLLDLGEIVFSPEIPDDELIEGQCLMPNRLIFNLAANVNLRSPKVGQGKFQIVFLIASETSTEKVSATIQLLRSRFDDASDFQKCISFT